MQWNLEEIDSIAACLEESSELPFVTRQTLARHNIHSELAREAASCLTLIDCSFNGTFVGPQRLEKNEQLTAGLGDEVFLGKSTYDHGMMIPLVSFTFKLIRDSNPLVSLINATPNPNATEVVRRGIDPAALAVREKQAFKSPIQRRRSESVGAPKGQADCSRLQVLLERQTEETERLRAELDVLSDNMESKSAEVDAIAHE